MQQLNRGGGRSHVHGLVEVALGVPLEAADFADGSGGGGVTGQPAGIGTLMRLAWQSGTPASEPTSTSWSGEGGWRQAGGS